MIPESHKDGTQDEAESFGARSQRALSAPPNPEKRALEERDRRGYADQPGMQEDAFPGEDAAAWPAE